MSRINRIDRMAAKGTCYLFAALLVGGLPSVAAAAIQQSSTYTVSGNWTAPEGVNSVSVSVWGGGGGGGGGTGGGFGGSGGGGGGYASRYVSLTPGENCSFIVGNGGTGNPSGTGMSGGQSWFRDMGTVAASGGGGGGPNGGAIGNPGNGTVGDTMYFGSPGVVGGGAVGGMGGSGSFPNGGAGGPGSNTSNNGYSGTVPGGGGGGGGPNAGTSGGTGASGQVVLTWYLPNPENVNISNLQQTSLYASWSYTSNLRGYLVQASTAANFTGSIIAGETVSLGHTLSGLTPNTTYHIRVGTLWTYATYYASPLTVVTQIEPPTNIYFDEVSSWTITASGYAAEFTGLDRQGSGLAISDYDGFYSVWNGTGNYWNYKGLTGGYMRNDAAGAVVGGKFYMVGGTPDGGSYSDSIIEYDPVVDNWTLINNMVYNRSSLSAAVVAGKVYLMGGFNVDTLNYNEEYDPVSNTMRTMAALPEARERHAAAVVDGKIYLIGGYREGAGTIGTVHVYDPAFNTWKPKKELPNIMERMAAGVFDGKIYVAGGYDGVESTTTVLEYRPADNFWYKKADMPTARASAAAGVIGGKFYVAGGYNGDASYFSVTEAYDPVLNEWTLKSSATLTRASAASGVLKGRLYVAGGNNSPPPYLNNFEEYEPGVSRRFTGLLPNQPYNFKVKARNQNWAETSEVQASVYTLAVATMPAGQVFTSVMPEGITVNWSQGIPANGPNASFLVQTSTENDFTGELRFQNVWNQNYYTFNYLAPKTTYYFRVQAYNAEGVSDYSWTVLGSTQTPARPLDGAVISTMAWTAQNFNWSRNMARDSHGGLYMVYLRLHNGTNHVFISSSSDNGRTWGEYLGEPIDAIASFPDAGFNQRWPALAIDSEDGLHLVWGGDAGAGPRFAYSYAPAPGVSWTPFVTIPAGTISEGPFSIAVDSKDGLHVAWSGLDTIPPGGDRIRYSSRTAVGGWVSPQVLNNDGNQADSPALTIDESDGVHLLVRRAPVPGTDIAAVISYSSRSADTGWGLWNNIYIAENPGVGQSRPSLTMTPDGGLFAVWNSSGDGNSNEQVRYARMPAAGSWTAAAYVGPEPTAPQRYPVAAADALGSVYVLWSGSDTVNDAVNLKGSIYDGSVWKTIDDLTDEESGAQIYPALRWSGWRNNGGGLDVAWYTWDGTSSTGTLRLMQGQDVPMSPGWSEAPWPAVEGCGYAINVAKGGNGDFTGIQQALAAVPTELSTDTCVVIRDLGPYDEQVTVQGIQTARWYPGNNETFRLSIMTDPGQGSYAVINPPALSTAAFHVLVASVTIQGFDIAPAFAMPYGILASSAGVSASSVNVISGGNINFSGVRISSYSVVEHSDIAAQPGHGLWIDGVGSEVSFSTMTSSSKYGLYLPGSDFNKVTRSYISSANNIAARLENGANNNAISYSTMTGGGVSFGLHVMNSGSNTITNSYIYSPGYGVNFIGSSNQNTISYSTMIAEGSYCLNIDYSDLNTISNSYVNNPSGRAVNLNGADNNNIAYSTITSGGDNPGLYINNSSSNTISDSYVRGSTGVYVNCPEVTMIRGSVLEASYAAGNGIFVQSGAQGGVFVTSSTLSGGINGSGFTLGAWNNDKIELSSNTITGGKYGLDISTLGAGGSLEISSITFAALSPGATAINFRGGLFVTQVDQAYFASEDIDVNVSAAGLTPGSTVFFGHPEGKWGAVYEVDPYNYIRWPTSEASLFWPPDDPFGITRISPVAALRAGAEGGYSSAQYHFQLDTAETMDSGGIQTPRHSFDQAGAGQNYPNIGAFSGQDGAISMARDSFLIDSTATFVFYSTGSVRLAPYTSYYWRARVRTAESGEYGPWTSTAAFITDQLASAAPVNNLEVSGVTLSSPTAEGVSVGFTLRENNVINGTAGGAAYNTADWIFVKFSTHSGADGTWNHATLTEGEVGAGATLAVASDNKGVFIDHDQSASYWTAGATVTWNYAADGVASGNAVVKVFAISMVKVPEGSFTYNAGGIGGTETNNYGYGVQREVTGPGIATGNGIDNNLPLNAPVGWPNGYNSFYIMRYELTQGQYADFLNTVHSSTAAVLYSADTGYGHRMSDAGAYYSAEDRFAAKNFLSTSDLWSFLSWAALRPMTEMEFEKASREVGIDDRKYPWGYTEPDSDTYMPVNEGGQHARNFLNYNNVDMGQKVLDVGRYMSGDIYRTTEETGASPYGIADLAGNVWEHVLNCSYTSVPENGNGTEVSPAGWPAANNSRKGLRGGSWLNNASIFSRVSDRNSHSWTSYTRISNVGGRGVRTP